jgi:hypothetical protein
VDVETVSGEAVVDTGLEYRPGDPVRVRVQHRERRVTISDDGAARDRAGLPAAWRVAAERVLGELEVNITRHGVICLPVVPVGPGEDAIVNRIGRASLIFYQELLELQT